MTRIHETFGLIDSHCHLHMLKPGGDWQSLDDYLDFADQSGVKGFLTVAVDPDSICAIDQLTKQYRNVFGAIGIHPNETECSLNSEMFDSFKTNDKLIAVGETGLDYYRDYVSSSVQKERFAFQLNLARELNKPLVIHVREAKQDTLDILKAEKASEMGGIIHCFTEDWEMASRAMDLGFHIGFSGIVTFNSAKTLQEVAKKMPRERILVETDCPYLAPVPHRGKPNQPAYVSHVAKAIAQLRNESEEDVANYTTDNFMRLFPSTREVFSYE